MTDAAVVGRTGVLTISTRGADGSGEVLIKIRGGSETYLAFSEAPLPKGQTVLVIACRTARTVDVVAWTDPFTAFAQVPE
ncbi:MAG: hypothetical protein ACRDRN_09795 [Sciscionella sp.]